MSGEQATVWAGRRAGMIVAQWSQRPAMAGVPVEKRTQDQDLEFEELPDDHADVVAFMAAQAARLPRWASFSVALERLTQPEYDALDDAMKTDRVLKRFYDRAVSQGTIDMNADDTHAALAKAVKAGLFTEARLAELFAA